MLSVAISRYRVFLEACLSMGPKGVISPAPSMMLPPSRPGPVKEGGVRGEENFWFLCFFLFFVRAVVERRTVLWNVCQRCRGGVEQINVCHRHFPNPARPSPKEDTWPLYSLLGF